MDEDKLFHELFDEEPPKSTNKMQDDPFKDWFFGDDNCFVNAEAAADDNQKILKAVQAVSGNKQHDDKSVKAARRPKLNEHTLMTPMGLPKLRAMFQKHKIDLNEGPYENIHRILAKTEYWAHNFHPSLNFDDFLDRVKLLGNKRVIKAAMSEFKSGMSSDYLCESDVGKSNK